MVGWSEAQKIYTSRHSIDGEIISAILFLDDDETKLSVNEALVHSGLATSELFCTSPQQNPGMQIFSTIYKVLQLSVHL